MGYDYEICYKEGKENVVADGLFRTLTAQLLAISPLSINAALLDHVKQCWVDDGKIQDIMSKLSTGVVPKYSYSQGLLYTSGFWW